MREKNYIPLSKWAKNITGQRFGKLLALGPVGNSSDRSILWLCQCDCGNETTVRCASLTKHNTLSCGCLKIEIATIRLTTHGKRKDSTYNLWARIIQRCTNLSHPRYKNWGGRGIEISDEWRQNFQKFYDHIAQLPDFGKENYTLDRIDNNGDYQPGNVRWASKIQQNRNSRHVHLLTHNNVTVCLSEWSERTGIPSRTISDRIRHGWSVEKTLTTPVKARRQE